MGASKAEKPAQRERAGGLPSIDHLGRLIDFDAKLNICDFQSDRLARRFGLSLHLAALVAELAFPEREAGR